MYRPEQPLYLSPTIVEAYDFEEKIIEAFVEGYLEYEKYSSGSITIFSWTSDVSELISKILDFIDFDEERDLRTDI